MAMAMASPKAILICSLLTTYITKAVAINRWCPDGAGEWNDRYINAANGLAHSRRSAEVLWRPRQNVRVGKNRITATSGHSGRKLADVKLMGILRVRDWEAIAINKENGTSYIYLADIEDERDNLRSSIYKFKEPRVSRRWRGHDIEIRSRDVERIRVRSPGHDCDAMVVDPSNGDILIFTKSNRRHGSKVYKVPQGSGDSKTKTKKLEYVT